MAHACKLCIMTKGINGGDVASLPQTEEEFFDHLEREHHVVIPREGESQDDADRRVLASGFACDECRVVLEARLASMS